MSPRLDLDRDARRCNGGRTLLGGDPPRVLALTPAGAAATDRLLAGTAPDTPALAALAGRLVEAGIAHPRREPGAVTDVTVVIPVRDRADQLDRCLSALGRTSAPAAVPTLVVDDGSRDVRTLGAVCAAHGAVHLRRETPGGPAVARNLGLSHASTGLVAFLDSDCVPEPGWLATLCGALDDPRVGAVAPRIRPLNAGGGPAGSGAAPAGSGAAPAGSGAVSGGVLARFSADRSPLDLGPHPANVHPGGRVAYVPTAALLARVAALGDGFDPDLRYGEDVDLVWRIRDRGWQVRYEPAACVRHAEPERLTRLLRRRFAYGTSAGPLARRHPQRLAPLRLHPRPAAILALALAGRQGAAALLTGAHVARTARALGRLDVPPGAAARLALTGVADSGVAAGRASTMLLPGLLVVGLTRRRTAPGALALLLAEPARSWWRSARRLDPIRWSALAIADDVAYGAGVWVGSLRARTLAPLLPVLIPTVRAARPAPQPGAAARSYPGCYRVNRGQDQHQS